MIPILYEATETQFTSNGLGRLTDCVECKVHEERNGVYECQFDYPVTGHMFHEIYEGRIIACTHDDAGDVQPFDIYSHSAPIDGVVTFYAHHISYRLGEITVKPFTASSCAAAILGLKNNSLTTNPFSVWTNKAVNGNYNLEEPAIFRAMLGGTQGSLLDVFGTGEYVKLYVKRGEDTNVEIRYGKNLADIEEETDYSGSYTAVVPYWVGRNEDNEEVFVRLDDWVLDSGHTTYGGRTVVTPMDLSQDFQDEPTKAELESRARTKLNDSEAWLPSSSIKVDFVQLWQTEEYKDYAPLQRVRLCDTVSVYHPEMGISAYKTKVVDVVYNVLLDRFDEMTLGEPQTSFSQLIKEENTRAIAEATEKIAAFINNNDFVLENELSDAINHATSLITGGLGGYVVINRNSSGQPEEILILDSPNINQAQNVWRWNMNGLGFSSTGYNGTYTLGITQDGKIVADFITTGTLTGNIIKTGIISDATGNNYWNMQTGEFRLAGSTQVDANGKTLNDLATNDSVSDAAKTATNYITFIDSSNGIRIYDGEPSNRNVNYAQINSNGMDIYRGSAKVASFGETATIGKEDRSRAYIDYHSFQMNYGTERAPYVHFSDLRDTNGVASQTASFRADGTTTSYTLPNVASEITSVTVNGVETTSYTQSSSSTATTITFTTAPTATKLIVVTYKTTQSVKGFTLGTRATNSAIGDLSFSCGASNTVSGAKSGAIGQSLKANYLHQFVCGFSNNNKAGDLFEVGGGNNKNIFSVDQKGIYVSDHDSPIGTIVAAPAGSEYTNLTANTQAVLKTITLSDGVWVIMGQAYFVVSNDIHCYLGINGTSNSYRCSHGQGDCILQVVDFVTGGATYKLCAKVGTAKSIYNPNVYFKAVRII